MKAPLILLVYLLSLSTLFGQQIDLVQPADTPCTHENPSNALENGLLSASEGTQIVANDILIAPGDSFTLSQIDVHFFSQTIITDANITFYEDDGGLPGTVLGGLIDVVPSSVFDIGSFGLDAWKAIFDVPDFDFVGQADVETRYWIAVSVSNAAGNDQVYWETSTTSIIGQPVAFDDGTGWVLHEPGGGQTVDGVYKFTGECNLGSRDKYKLDFNVSPNPVTNLLLFSAFSPGTVSVTNIHGVVVFISEYQTGIQEFSLQGLPSGLYIVKLSTDLRSSTKKVIKQ